VKQADTLAGFAIVLFLISMGMAVAMWAMGTNLNDPAMWWIAACINAHSIISRLAR
jgi:predicted cobalt transporter CbtA